MNIGTHVYINGTGNRYNFMAGIFIGRNKKGVARVSVLDIGRPCTINVEDRCLTLASRVDEIVVAFGPMGLKDALRALRPRYHSDGLPGLKDGEVAAMISPPQVLSCNFISTTGDPNAIPDDNGNRRFMVLDDSAIRQSMQQSIEAENAAVQIHNDIIAAGGVHVMHDEYLMPNTPPVVARSADGKQLGTTDEYWLKADNRELLSFLRACGWLAADTAGKTAVVRTDTSVSVVHRHRKTPFVTLTLENVA